MAGKLHPPYIDGKVPAFSGTVLKVPFRNNRAVSLTNNQVSGMVCKLKTVSTNEWVWNIHASDWKPDEETGEYYALFDLSELYSERAYTGSNENITPDSNGCVPYYQWLIVGLYYKIQIAYIDQYGQIGYFSDVGVTKYTSQPTIYIEELNSHGTSGSLYNYIGVYNQLNGDTSEKAFSYSFTIYDEADNVFITSGSQTHNSSFDTASYESHDEFYCNKELNPKKTYKIQYKVITNNNLVCESPMYLIVKKETVKPALNADLVAEYSYDDGYIKLSLAAKDDKYYSGNFAIARSSSKDNYETWDEICRFSLDKNFPQVELFKDFTVEQGIAYRYSIQQYNSRGLYSSRILSNTLYADFEDMFLFDGKKQLKVRFNPNVSSFKNTILEQKTDTIGSKYPFIFRNGHVKYKEIPIAGLISYLMDDQEYFINKQDLGYMEFNVSTDLTSDNIRAERVFKLEVLEWLNNGEVKLFRSPTEGNYLVRLLNVSLSPNAPLGRMLHTFQCTGYEVGAVDFNTLNSYGMFKTPILQEKVMRFSQIQLGGVENYETREWDIEPVQPIFTTNTPPTIATIEARANKTPIFRGKQYYVASITDCAPDTIFGLQFESGVSQNMIEYIRIGETGVYEINSYDNALVAVYPIWTPRITLPVAADRHMDGKITFGYYEAATTDNFSSVIDFDIYDKLTQWYGLHNNIIDEIENLRVSTGRFYWLKFQRRAIQEVYVDNNELYYDRSHLVEMPYNTLLPTTVYADCSGEIKHYYNGKDLMDNGIVYTTQQDESIKYARYAAVIDNPDYYWTDDTKDSWTGNPEDIPADRQYKFAINHQDYNVDLKTVGRYIITDIDSIDFLSIGRMLMVDCYYQVTERTFAVEESDQTLASLRTSWMQLLESYYNNITNESSVGEEGEYYDQAHFDALFTQPGGINDMYEAYYTRLEELLNAEVEG